MFYPEKILESEFFPQELPPCFSSLDVSREYLRLKRSASIFSKEDSIPFTYSGFKSEKARRKYAIPNICGFINLINCIESNATEIFDILAESNFSITKPIIGSPPSGKPYKKKCYNISEAKSLVEKIYQNNTTEIRLDIMSFFDSVYTHTIPWVIHTKKIAKAKRRDKNLLGNQLDFYLQRINHGQTNGILVGNAASRIISEIMLCKIDKKIEEEFPDLRCYRFVDDYYIYVKNYSECQKIISFIRNELSEYELQLNENKLQINNSPFLFDKCWLNEMKLFLHLNSDVLFDKTISLYKEWKVMESKLLNLWVRFPSLSDIIVKFLARNINNLTKTNIKNSIYSLIDKCLEHKFEGELIWCLWIANAFSIKLNQEYLIKVLKSSNSLAIIIVLDIIRIQSNNSVRINNNLKLIVDDLRLCDIDMNRNSGLTIKSERWLLVYEAELNSWLYDNGNLINYASSNQFFNELLNLDIHFYKRNINVVELYSNDNSIDKWQYITKNEFKKYIKKVSTRNESYSGEIHIPSDELDEIFEELLNEISLY